MRPIASTLILALLTAVVALVAFVQAPGPDEFPSVIVAGSVNSGGLDVTHQEQQLQQPPQKSLPQNESSESLLAADRHSKPAFTERRKPPDEETIRQRLRERVTWETRRLYSPLIAELGLTPREEKALISLLIEDRIAATWTPYKDGEPWTREERADKIVAIIGDAGLQEFQALVDRKLPAYGRMLNVKDLLQHYDVPLTDSQHDGLLKILIRVQEQYGTRPPSGVGQERLENTLAHLDEFQRHVLELAPSVLSAEQVRYLFEQYQHMSYERAAALERQTRDAAAGEDVLWSYPAWHPMWQRH